ncbi:MAG: nucleoside diphosphate kinase regulator [Spirochaetales bacterium]|nr:nucleoside diphosphate kinase regulator [Spirochaetales bacterium]
MKRKSIMITDFDKARLLKLIQLHKLRKKNTENLAKLEEELNRAIVVLQTNIPNNTVTLNSKVRYRILSTNEEKTCTIVFPHAVDSNNDKISILSPIATSLIGYSTGDEIDWEVPGGKIRIKVLEILYQPEASGDFTQ